MTTCLVIATCCISATAQPRQRQGTPSRKQENQQAASARQAASPMKLQIQDDGRQFTIKNTGDEVISDLKITSYTEPRSRTFCFSHTPFPNRQERLSRAAQPLSGGMIWSIQRGPDYLNPGTMSEPYSSMAKLLGSPRELSLHSKAGNGSLRRRVRASLKIVV